MHQLARNREVVRLATLPRGRDGEEFRISVDEFRPDDGEPKRYVNVRVWFRNGQGEMRPGKAGCSVRRGEIEQTIAALQDAQRFLAGEEQQRRAVAPKQEPSPWRDEAEDV